MDLETTMASLRINDTNKKENSGLSDIGSNAAEPSKDLRRSAYFRPIITYVEKRRVYTKPMKVSLKDNENYYLNKRSKIPSPNLETIYEDRIEETLQKTEKIRTKKQNMKVRSLSAQKRLANKKKFSLKILLDKLAELDKYE